MQTWANEEANLRPEVLQAAAQSQLLSVDVAKTLIGHFSVLQKQRPRGGVAGVFFTELVDRTRWCAWGETAGTAGQKWEELGIALIRLCIA